MEYIAKAFAMNIIAWPEVALRIFLAAIFGLILGIERESKNKPIDFRAFMIVGVSTCILAILSQELYADYSKADGVVRIDLGNIISGVLTGIGFLGAGAILKKDSDVVGTATGASIWASGGMGLALGFGFYGLAILSFLIVSLILVIGGYLLPYMQGRQDAETKNNKADH